MQVQTNRWNEQCTGSRYVGCVGYDDPVYETYPYTASCTERVIVFDTPEEKQKFHDLVVSMQPQAQEMITQRTNDILEEPRAAWKSASEEYVAQVLAFQHRNAARHWLSRTFTFDHPPYTEPRVSDYEREALNKLGEDELIVTAKLIVAHPTEYSLFIEKLLADDYKRIIGFRIVTL